MKTLAEQLDCARRCQRQREKSYPKMVGERRMTMERAQHEIDCMAEIVGTLEKLKLLEEVSEELRSAERGTRSAELGKEGNLA